MASSTRALQSVKNLYDLLKSGSLTVSACREVLADMENNLEAAPVFKIDTFLKTLAVASKTFRVEKRKNGEVSAEWDEVLQTSDKLMGLFKKRQEEGDCNDGDSDGAAATDDGEGVPTSASVYLGRLKRQRKELYKNPPVLPPSSIVVQEKRAPLPTRDTDGFLAFEPGTGKYDKTPVKLFQPNLTPEEILRGGAFGGTYFRSIVSAVTNKRYTAKEALSESVPDEWIEGLDKETMLTSQVYNTEVNKFRAKCGGSLGMWESSGWISDADPYGWFQWYCRFYQGRRTSDDARQMARWKGVAGLKGRFRSQLCNKIVNAGARADDTTISPVIRQTLWHWGLQVNEKILDLHKKR